MTRGLISKPNGDSDEEKSQGTSGTDAERNSERGSVITY